MRLQSISLLNFRNYKELSLTLEAYSQIALVGMNAQGKSNFIEAIYALALVNSYRTAKLEHLITWGESQVQVSGTVLSEQHNSLYVQLGITPKGRKSLQVNYNYIKRLADYIGTIKVVLFSTRDLQMVLGAPQERRRFMDILLAQTFPRYYSVLSQYSLVLKQRNLLLKSFKQISPYDSKRSDLLAQLDLWDVQLSQYGSFIISKRLQIMKNLQRLVQKIHQNLVTVQDELLIHYQMGLSEEGHILDDVNQIELEERLLQAIVDRRSRDIRQTQTTFGPHRDDMILMLNGKELRTFGSQGQIRTAILALKISEMLYFSELLHEIPLLLLDDVFSELDLKRQKALLDFIRNTDVQMFLTTTHLTEELNTVLQEKSVIFEVKQGALSQREAGF